MFPPSSGYSVNVSNDRWATEIKYYAMGALYHYLRRMVATT